jgi:hypothetical protein
MTFCETLKSSALLWNRSSGKTLLLFSCKDPGFAGLKTRRFRREPQRKGQRPKAFPATREAWPFTLPAEPERARCYTPGMQERRWPLRL